MTSKSLHRPHVITQQDIHICSNSIVNRKIISSVKNFKKVFSPMHFSQNISNCVGFYKRSERDNLI